MGTPPLFTERDLLLRLYGTHDYAKGLFGIAPHHLSDGTGVLLIGHGSHDSRTRNRLLGLTGSGTPFTVDRSGGRVAMPSEPGAFASRPYEEPAEGLYVASGTDGRSWWLNCDPLGPSSAPTTVVCWDGRGVPRSHRVGPGAHTRGLAAHQGIVYAHQPTDRAWPAVSWAREDAPEFLPVEARAGGPWDVNIQITLVPTGDRVLGFSTQLAGPGGRVSNNPPYFVIEPDRTAAPLAFSDAEVWGEERMQISEVAGRRFRVWPQVHQGFALPTGIHLVTTSGLFVIGGVGERPRLLHEEARGAFFEWGERLFRLDGSALQRWETGGFREIGRLDAAEGGRASAAVGPGGRLFVATSVVTQAPGERRRADVTVQAWDADPLLRVD